MSKNKLKTEKPAAKKPRAQDPNVLKKDKEPEVKVKELVKDERTHKVLGVVCLLLALYCFIAFTSYLFTWEEDQDKVFRYSASVLFMDDIKVDNLLGRLGAFVSHWFFYKGFGMASYLFCYFFFILGVNFIVGRRVFRIWRNVKHILFGLLFISASLAFATSAAGFPWGGALGDAINKWTSGFLGHIGAALLLLVAGLAWLIWKFNFDFKWPERAPKPAVAPLAADTCALPEEEAPFETTVPAPEKPSRQNAMKAGSGVVVIPPHEEEEELPELQLIERDDEPEVSPLISYVPPPVTELPAMDTTEELSAEMEEISAEEEEEEEADGPLLYIEETVVPATGRRHIINLIPTSQ